MVGFLLTPPSPLPPPLTQPTNPPYTLHHPIPMPGGYMPTLETKQRECWKVYPRLTRDFDSRVHGQPSILVSEKLSHDWKEDG